MVEWITNVISSLGYLGIGVLMTIEGFFPPLPSELILSLAGFSVTQGKLSSLLWVVVAGTIGSVIGVLPWYYIGKLVGEQRLREWIDKHGKWLRLSGKDIDRMNHWFGKYGRRAVLFGRLVPTIRTYISIPAGIEAMPLLHFLLYSLVGISLWVGLLAYAGYVLGQNYQLVKKFLSFIVLVIIAAIVIVYGSRFIMHRMRKQAGKSRR
ncbi:DedA family protein [Scytonema sp. UIC 10036]|uniref:DedA family protein n=1 Tax=Scytonema sp. UIC 10036 TaxID=2304196 RepID=UPI0012DAD229|nr:DedA family protein [Scytonema sp. UIC 10036]MUG91393.1 DedA family protein [Scytonema sp. UIC 10036]